MKTVFWQQMLSFAGCSGCVSITGLFRFTGLPLVTLAITAAVTAANLRQLRNWHDRTGNGDPSNPLLAEPPTFHGFVLLEEPAAEPQSVTVLPDAA